MDYTREPVSSLLRGPLIHTPQGIVVVFSSILYLMAAALFSFTDITPPFGYSSAKTVVFCIGWPVIMFMLYIKKNLPQFEPSWSEAGFLAFCSPLPVLYPLWMHLT
jgi:hypothetical protein